MKNDSKIYVVGGAVRDALLGLAVHDKDWVVVGSTPEDMTALGYLPVGKDFPVFPASQDPRGICAGTHRAQDRARLPRLCRLCRTRRDARARPIATRLHDQRHRAR